jgi:hypothetical protein
MAVATAKPSDSPLTPRDRPDRLLRRGAIGAAVATLMNLGIYGLAVVGGLSFHLRGQADVFITAQALTSGFRRVNAYNVAIDTAVPFLGATLLFRLAARRSRATAVAVLILAAVAALLVFIELPHVAYMSARTSVALATMDVVATTIFVGLFARALPTAPDASARTPQGRRDRTPPA